MMSLDPLIPLPQAAEMLALTASELRRMVAARDIACVRRSSPGGRARIKFRLSEIDRWVKAHTIPARRPREEACTG